MACLRSTFTGGEFTCPNFDGSLNINSVDSVLLCVLLNLVSTHKLLHASLAQTVSVQDFE
jgi:hypothetical protein